MESNFISFNFETISCTFTHRCSSHEMELSEDDECDHCILRVTKAVTKVTGDDGEKVKFVTCADVSVVNPSVKGGFNRLFCNVKKL